MIRNYQKDLRELLSIYSKPGAQKLDSIIESQVTVILSNALADLKEMDRDLQIVLDDAKSEASFGAKLDGKAKQLMTELSNANTALQNIKESVQVEMEHMASQIHTQYGTKDGEGGRETQP